MGSVLECARIAATAHSIIWTFLHRKVFLWLALTAMACCAKVWVQDTAECGKFSLALWKREDYFLHAPGWT
jgi:hypothetical protein